MGSLGVQVLCDDDMIEVDQDISEVVVELLHGLTKPGMVGSIDSMWAQNIHCSSSTTK